jgi:hypothetical protein
LDLYIDDKRKYEAENSWMNMVFLPNPKKVGTQINDSELKNEEVENKEKFQYHSYIKFYIFARGSFR